MSAGLLISPEEYMARTFEHDVEFVSGELVPRAMPTYDHSRLQAVLAAFFGAHEKEWGLRGLTEQRVQVASRRYRIPDVCLIDEKPEKPYVTKPPVLAVEILSPDEDMVELLQKVREYQEMGIPNIWIIDPVRKTGTVFAGGTSSTVRDGRFRAGVIEVDLNQLPLE